ncbi:hypothetical protein H2203_000011 [Taxawa tesnikishii (nom. ined.)]|nr:hypothetical protein H2203_000011 [Dothideales sp. JES 119]
MSAISGTTAKTSFSDGQVADLDPSNMVFFLPVLERASDLLLQYLTPIGSSDEKLQVNIKETTTAGSNRRKRLDALARAFDIHQENYSNSAYLRPDLILRALTGVFDISTLPFGAWRPDNVVYKANLSIFAQQMNSLHTAASDTSTILESLDTTFPSQFMCFLMDDNSQVNPLTWSALVESTCTLAIELRTQLVIQTLLAHRKHPDYDAQTIVAKKMFEIPDDVEGSLDLKSCLSNFDFNHGPLRDMLSQDRLELFHKRLFDRLEAIGQPLRDPKLGPDAALQRLQGQHPLQDFQILALRWARERVYEVDACIAERGGVDSITRLLQSEVDRINAQGEEAAGAIATPKTVGKM